MIKISHLIAVLLLVSNISFAQDSAIAIATAPKEITSIQTTGDEPDYTLMAKRDAKKYFSTKRQFWTGVVCGFTPIVGWVAAPIIGATVKLKDEQLYNPSNKNGYLKEKNATYAAAYRKYSIRKRTKNFVFGFGIGFASIAGYWLATQGEYKN